MLKKRYAAKLIVCAALIASCFVQNANAQAGAATIAGSAAVYSVIEQLREATQSVINQLETSTNKTQFEVRSSLVILMQTLNNVAGEITVRTFGELNKTQQDFFNNLNRSLAEWRRTSKVTANDISSVLSQLNDTIGTLPGANRRPRVLKFAPSMISMQEATRNKGVRVSVSGSWLGHDEPTLAVANQACSRLTKTETTLEFQCSLAAFRAPATIMPLSGKLTVVNFRTFWEKVGGLVSDNKRFVTYDLGFALVPQEMGVASISTSVDEIKRETRVRPFSFRHDNGHCEGARNVAWTVNADVANRWQIDVTTIAASTYSGGGFQGVVGANSSGFQVTGRVQNHGSCGPLGIGKDGRGHLEVKGTFTEFRDLTTTRMEAKDPVKIFWGRDHKFDLPTNARAIISEVSLVNGEKFIERTSTSRNWYSFDVDLANKVVVLRPKSIEEALGK